MLKLINNYIFERSFTAGARTRAYVREVAHRSRALRRPPAASRRRAPFARVQQAPCPCVLLLNHVLNLFGFALGDEPLARVALLHLLPEELPRSFGFRS